MNSLFRVHKLNEAGLRLARDMAEEFNNLADFLEDVPDCREKSIALTKLEEACFFAKKAIAIQPDNQQKEDK